MRLLDILKSKRDDEPLNKTIEESSEKSHDILNEVQKEALKFQSSLRRSKKKSMKEYRAIDKKLNDVASRIAIITGYK